MNDKTRTPEEIRERIKYLNEKAQSEFDNGQYNLAYCIEARIEDLKWVINE